MQQQRDLLSGSWVDISPGHNLPLPVQEGPGVLLREGGEQLQHRFHAFLHRLQGQKEEHSRVSKAWLRSALEQTIAQGLGLSGVSEERPAQGKKNSPFLIPSPHVPPAQSICRIALPCPACPRLLSPLHSQIKKFLQNSTKSFLTICDPGPPMSVCTQPGWRVTQRMPCSRYPRDWHLVSMFRAACGETGQGW